MARKGRIRGSVSADRGNLNLRIYWRDPSDPTKERRWNVPTGQKDTPGNRELYADRLVLIDAKMKGGAFFPCQEFPGTKIAAYCHCAECSIIEPLDRTHQAPNTLGELLTAYKVHEQERATGTNRVIEGNTVRTKGSHINALSTAFIGVDGDGDPAEMEPLSDYLIHELTPELVRGWLLSYQSRSELDVPLTTKYMNDLAADIRHALKYGRFRRWWRTHPMLEHDGYLVEISKEEKNRQVNKKNFKPFSLLERDRIIGYFKQQYEQCPIDQYKGKDKPHRAMLYAYVVLGFNTGMRSPSEITALEWSDISFSDRTIHVWKSRESSGKVEQQIIREYTKTVHHRHVPMNDAVAEALRLIEQYRQDDGDWIFWNPRASKTNPLINKGGWAPMTGEKRIRTPFDKALEATQIPKMDQGQYRMRHTFVTTVLDNTDLEDSIVAHWIGDTVETMRKHYQGHCKNRWRSQADMAKLNAINTINSGLSVVKAGKNSGL
jgi:integrase